MTLVQIIRLLNRNFFLLMGSSLTLAILVFLLTKRQPKEYQSETEIYTGLASGLNVSSVEQRSPLDFFSTSNAFDNLMNVIRSRQTLEETGERLLARHLALGEPVPGHIGPDAWKHTLEMLDDEIRSWLGKGLDEDSLLTLIKQYKKENYTKENAKWIFFSSTSPYSHEAIGRIDVYRVGNSDLIKISYKWTDPGIVQETLLILNDVFTFRMGEIKSGQSNDVVDYFRKQVDLALEVLNESEEKLKIYKTENQIINYGEQTKSIAMMKESFEDEYQKELAIKASAEAALTKLDSQLALNREILKFSDEILKQRSRLAELNGQIALMETYYNNDAALEALKIEATKIRSNLSNELTKRYQYSKTKEGLPIKDILSKWLENSLALDASNARLEIFTERKAYFGRVYDRFSPLGSNLNRMEREVLVAEKNYLELLHSLNQALMKQKSEAMVNSGLVVTVPPSYPLSALKSKRLVMVMGSAIVGFVLPLAFILLTLFLDSSIRTPTRVIAVTRLKLLGAMPDLSLRKRLKDVKVDELMDISLGVLIQNTKLELRREELTNQKPVVITAFSTREAEGTSFVMYHLISRLVRLNYNVLYVYPDSTMLPDEFPAQVVQKPYTYDLEHLNAAKITDLFGNGLKLEAYDLVFVELPALLTATFPFSIIERSDMSFLVADARRKWGKADSFALEEIRQVLKVNPKVVLNRTDVDDLEEVVGDIPKKRSGLRRWFKHLTSFEFRT